MIAIVTACGCGGQVVGVATGGTAGAGIGNVGNLPSGGTGNAPAVTGGSGNVSFGGAGNSGNAPPTDCAGVAVVDASRPLIADFECLPGPDGEYFGWFPLASWDDWQHGAYWYWNDVMDPSYQSWDCRPSASGGLGEPGHDSAHAGFFTTHVPMTSWGGGFGIWMSGIVETRSTVSCIDATAFTGVSYWVKGSNTAVLAAGSYTLQVSTFDTAPAYPAVPLTCTTDASGASVCTGEQAGGCTAVVCGPYEFTPPPLTDQWTHVVANWADFRLPAYGTTAPLDPAKLSGINFATPAGDVDGTIDLWVDDVEFIGGGPTQIPRTCTGVGAGGAGGSTSIETAGEPSYLAVCPSSP